LHLKAKCTTVRPFFIRLVRPSPYFFLLLARLPRLSVFRVRFLISTLHCGLLEENVSGCAFAVLYKCDVPSSPLRMGADGAAPSGFWEEIMEHWLSKHTHNNARTSSLTSGQ
jgi:hypothetical protein